MKISLQDRREKKGKDRENMLFSLIIKKQSKDKILTKEKLS